MRIISIRINIYSLIIQNFGQDQFCHELMTRLLVNKNVVRDMFRTDTCVISILKDKL